MTSRSPSPKTLPFISDTLMFVALMPMAVIATFLTGDTKWVMAAGLAVPALVAILRIFMDNNHAKDPTDDLTGLPLRKAIEDKFDEVFAIPGNAVRTSACVVIDLDSFHAFNERWGREAADRVLQVTADRLTSTVRKDDLVIRLEADAFSLALLPAERMTLDTVLALSERILRAIAEPIPINGTNAYVSASVGIALASKIGARSGGAIIAAAERAMVEARSHGAGALRVYSPHMQTITKASHALGEDVSKGLEEGQIKAWFQPQISTESGAVSGFEALARWTHPQRGPIMPNEFIPAIQAAGRSERLSEVMLYEAMSALVAWERAGLKVPCVAVNFAGAELRNPRIIDKVRWELDRFGLTPDRLAVEIVESVVCETTDDIILRNIAALSEFGCRIDLDDFGTGHASISAIKRFRINRIKIDKSFVRRVDQDGDQQRMVAAILTMSHQMGIESLGEGVESLGEHSILSQLGCDHVQGFGIGRPRPREDTIFWLRGQDKNNKTIPRIGLSGRPA